MFFPACVAFSLIHAQAISPQVRQHFLAAERDQRQGRLEAAVQEYKDVLHLQGDIPEVYANLGLVYYALGDFTDSSEAFIRAEKLRPHMFGVNLWLGIDYVKLNKPARAVPLLHEATVMDSANKEAQSWLGLALWNSGRTDAAIDQLAKANHLFPNDIDISYTLGEAYRKVANQEMESIIAASSGEPLQDQIYGDIYRQQGLWAKAVAHYRLALKRDPEWHGAHLGIGKTYLTEHESLQAQQEFESELAVDSSSVAAYALLGESAMLQGNVQHALEMLHVAIARSPEEASAALGIPPPPMSYMEPLSQAALQALRGAETLLEQSPPGPARSLALAFVKLHLQKYDFEGDWTRFQAIVGKRPEPRSANERAALAFDRQQYSGAKRDLRGWLRLHPHDLQAHYLLARTYRRLSLQVLDGLMKTHPDSYRSHELLAETYENRGDDKKALAEYRIVEQMEPDLPLIHFEIGQILWQDIHPNEALKELHKELTLDPANAEATGEIGTIFVEQHEPLKAIPYLKRALRMEPNLWQIHKELGTAYMIEKEYPQAEVELSKALKYDRDGSAHYQLALVYRAEGRRDEAAREFEAAKKIKEAHPVRIFSTAQEAGAP